MSSMMSMVSSVSVATTARPQRPKLARLDTSERNLLARIDTAGSSSNNNSSRPTTPRADGPKRNSPRGLGNSESPRLTLVTGSTNAYAGVCIDNRRHGRDRSTSTEKPNSDRNASFWPECTGETEEDVSGSDAVNTIGSSNFNASGGKGCRDIDVSHVQQRCDFKLEGESFSDPANSTSLRSSTLPIQSTPPLSRASDPVTFEVSEILQSFLYLGPEINTESEAAYLRDQLGIRRILNAAWEIEEGGGKHLNLDCESRSGFERYRKLPLKDTVEAKGVQHSIEEACAFLDDARLHAAPTYVHCKAGKSRSVMLVMAYLIHCNRWTLARAYDYVVDRRRDVSPNIGFVAELMTFAEKKLSAPHNRLDAGAGKRADECEDEHGEHHTVRNYRSSCDTQDKKESQLSSDAACTSPQDYISAPTGLTYQGRAMRESLPARPLMPMVSTVATCTSGDDGQIIDAADVDSIARQNAPWHFRASDCQQMQDNLNLPSTDYRGLDGRYHPVRPPADDQLQASSRLTTLAAIDTENVFLRTSATCLLDGIACDAPSYRPRRMSPPHSDSTSTGSASS